MSCLPKPTLGNILARNTPIVFITVFLFDFLYYGLITGTPGSFFSKDLVSKVIFTLCLALVYGYTYGRASRIWRDGNPPEAPGDYDYTISPFVCKLALRSQPNASCKATSAKIYNGIIFSLLSCSFFWFALLLGGVMVSVLYVFVLHGIRGEEVVIGYTDAAIKTGEVVLAGVILETHGKTESDGDY